MTIAYRSIGKGSTNESVILKFIDDTNGLPETGVTSASAGLDIRYCRDNDVPSSNFVTGDMSSLSGTHVDGLIGHIGAGLYRINAPDAAFTSSSTVNGVLFYGDCSGMIVSECYVPLVDTIAVDSNGYVSSNVVQISSDTVSADNLELAFQSTLAEPVGVPVSTDPIWEKVGYLFASVMNQITVSSGSNAVKTFYDNTGGSLYTKSIYDNGTIYTESGVA